MEGLIPDWKSREYKRKALLEQILMLKREIQSKNGQISERELAILQGKLQALQTQHKRLLSQDIS